MKKPLKNAKRKILQLQRELFIYINACNVFINWRIETHQLNGINPSPEPPFKQFYLNFKHRATR